VRSASLLPTLLALSGLAALSARALAQDQPPPPTPTPVPEAPPPDDATRLAELERMQAELQRRLDALDAERAAEAQAEAEAEAQGGPVMRWNEYSAFGHRIKFTGFLRCDAIYDDSRPNNTQVIGFVLSEDPNAPRNGAAAFGSKKDREDLTIHPRHTRFGFDYDGPIVEALGGMKLTGKLEFDLYTAAFSESRQAIRLRHAYARMAWGDFNILAGQTSDLISPLYPIANPDLAMWGAGNLGDRRPQFRATYRPAVGPGTLEVAGMVGLTGADDASDIDLPGVYGAGYRDGETSGLPTLQARVAYELPMFEKEKLVIGAGVHGAWEDPDRTIQGHAIFKSWAVALDVLVPIYLNYLWVKGEAWQGSNVDDVRGAIFQGINTTTGRTIDARGGWIELGIRPGTDWFAISFGYSTDQPDDSDLPAGGRAANKIAYVATRYTFGPLTLGLDYMYWVTEYNQFHAGRDNRVQAFVQFNF
jgi:hypothetical protein